MRSIVLQAGTKVLFPTMLMFSLFLLVRGHHEPGGGFAAGLVAAAAFAFYAISHDVAAARQALRLDPRSLVACGLLVAVASGVPALLLGEPYLTGVWAEMAPARPPALSFGTPLLFDAGVYLVVLGTTCAVLFTLGGD